MPRLKKKYMHVVASAPAPTVAPVSEPPAFSFDLKGASKHTGFSVWALRQAIYAGQLLVVNQKPYIIRRADLEAFVDSRVQKVA